jgi:type I restriction enzyme M protein
MIELAPSDKAKQQVKQSLYGFDTNPTVWALALLNMYFRGDGKSNIEHESSLTTSVREHNRNQFEVAFLNPPFSQENEPEKLFIDVSMDFLKPGGTLVVVVKAGMFADDDHKSWREEFTRNHTIQAVISLPDDLFYPTAAPTTLLIAKAHVPQNLNGKIFLARLQNDGFVKLKGKRVEQLGSEIPALINAYKVFKEGKAPKFHSMVLELGKNLVGGAEWSPQEWLPQPVPTKQELTSSCEFLTASILKTTCQYEDLSSLVLTDFGSAWENFPKLPYGETSLILSELFEVYNGKSSGEKNYIEGSTPYISSGDPSNSIVSLVNSEVGELFEFGGITVTAFGQAFVQPWAFLARGNGGSAVRVLIPRYKMSLRELMWFAAQINLQKWRFFYARMAIKSRIERLALEIPTSPLADGTIKINDVVKRFMTTYKIQQGELGTF